MKAKITQEVIHTLNKNEIFVFGSNEAGTHAGGAAHKAAKDFEAINVITKLHLDFEIYDWNINITECVGSILIWGKAEKRSNKF